MNKLIAFLMFIAVTTYLLEPTAFAISQATNCPRSINDLQYVILKFTKTAENQYEAEATDKFNTPNQWHLKINCITAINEEEAKQVVNDILASATITNSNPSADPGFLCIYDSTYLFPSNCTGPNHVYATAPG